MNKKLKNSCFLLAFMLVGMFMLTTSVKADEIDMYFGSEVYDVEIRESFYIGAYIGGEQEGDFEIQLSYDPHFLEYVEGAEQIEDGLIQISGSLNSTARKHLLTFRSLAGGETDVKVEKAVLVRGGQETDLDVSLFSNAPVMIEAENEALINGVKIDGQELAEFETDSFIYQINVPYEKETLEVEGISDENQDVISIDVSDTKLKTGENTIYITVKGRKNTCNIYTLKVFREEKTVEVTEETTEEAVTDQTVEVVGENDNETRGAENPYIVKLQGENGMKILPLIFGMLAILVASVVLFQFFVFCVKYFDNKKKKKKLQKNKTSKKKKEDSEENWNIEDLEKYIVADVEDLMHEEEPVISVQDVSMHFKVATENVSGIKELIIQKLKGKISFRTLKALDHVSFDVMQGEVVGIIGTNGSGKSTLLKIVSGALQPTSGQIIVDRRKVQLLTLGTGFDMELTAKENVYLNGAIIGYDRAFIDEKYDSIVKFAELEGFMEEKVKNFSSGMVSRLGFAIATAAETPEILILDEVLSVGDEFFRKKSLARIKEMIHSGSTVLMVSHGMGTILDNCTKAVWIEKGELKMIGEPKVVCEEYRKFGNEK